MSSISSSRVCATSRVNSRVFKGLSLALICTAILSGIQANAQAQITMEKLIGSSVSDISKYKDVRDAVTRFGAGDPNSARQLLEQATKNHPELAPADVLLAKMSYMSNNGNAGRKLLEIAVKKNPNDPEAYLIFAQQALAGGRVTDAAFLFSKAHDLNHNYKENAKRKRNFDMQAHAGLASVAESRQAWTEAQKNLEGWLQLDPESIQAMKRLAIVQFHSGNAKEAYKTFGKVARMDKKKGQLPADIWLATLYSRKGEAEHADKFYANALKNAGDNVPARLALAKWLLGKGENQRALLQVNLALKADPDHVEGLVLRGALARVAKENAAAEKNLERAHLIAPNILSPINQLALLLITKEDQKDKDRGLRFAVVGSQLHPKQVTAKVTLAWALLKAGRRNDAFRTMGEAQKLGGINGDNAYYFAQFLVQGANKKKDAIKLLESVVDQKGIVLHRQDAKDLLARLKGGASK